LLLCAKKLILYSEGLMVTHHHLFIGWRYFRKTLISLFINPIFLILTVIGNSIILTGATSFYYFEQGKNQLVTTYFDAYWWAMITVSTVGYGEIVPVTTAGRVTALLLIITGVAVFFSFVGLFTGMFINIELEQMERDVQDLKKKVLPGEKT
jgi:voltage-gated potassium channel Kch